MLISRMRTPVAETTRKQRRGSLLVETNVAKVRLIVGCSGNARARTADPMSIQSWTHAHTEVVRAAVGGFGRVGRSSSWRHLPDHTSPADPAVRRGRPGLAVRRSWPRGGSGPPCAAAIPIATEPMRAPPRAWAPLPSRSPRSFTKSVCAKSPASARPSRISSPGCMTQGRTRACVSPPLQQRHRETLRLSPPLLSHGPTTSQRKSSGASGVP
jgi:hypothetical protein